MKKSILVVLSVLALVAASIFGTLAYLTDTDTATNTFTVGQVKITLDELDVDNSTPGENDRDTANTYHLLPGHTYTKDPTIHVDANSEPCYLFVKVENGIADIEGGKTIAAQMAELGWQPISEDSNIYIFTKNGSKYEIYKSGDVVVFNNFTIDGEKVVNVAEGKTTPDGKFDIADYAEAEIKVTAYAVQAAGFEDSTPAEIWAAAAFN